MSTKVLIHGAAGRMGRRLVALSSADPTFELVGAVEHSESAFLGQDAGVLAQIPSIDLAICSELALESKPVIIDFALPKALPRLLEQAVAAGAPLVSGTTGIGESEKALFAEAGKIIPVMYSPNMSIGVNLLFLATRQMAKWVGEDFDIEIVEAHHKMKKDAPSGTALRLAEMAAEGREIRLDDVSRYSREGNDCLRKPGEIGVQSIRGGDIVGEHTVFYCTDGERIELTHRATSRDIFVRGALRTAKWLAQQKPGFYSMFDMLSM